ncbi:MAG: hypothetical protein KAG04_01135 [Mycoplasmataceae bacterium]|nr:hypothetical protein [Mycoplasmataceae bacterium]
MEVAYYPKEITNKKTTLVMGGFKIIHNGHKKLIDVAKEKKLPISMMIIERDTDIVSLDIRLVKLAKLGVDFVNVVKFDQKLKNTSGKDFLKKMKQITHAENIVVGEDFAFGKNKSFVAKDIEGAQIIKLEKMNSKKISTTLVKELIELGEVDTIIKISPFPLTVKLEVDAEKVIKTGLPAKLHSGIYAVFVIVNSVKYYGYIYLNMKKEAKIFVPDLQIVNNSFTPVVRLIMMTRKIFMTKQDKLETKDEEQVVEYLNKHIQ